jgi:phosphohistidine phosphatase
MMKTVLLIRHAKSSWGDLSLPDFERPLNDRGKADAPKMAKRIHKKKISIDTFVSSPAKRAKKTAEVFAEQYGVKKSDIVFVQELYHANDETYYEAIAGAPAESDSIAIFSHNPGITEFANRLTENRIDNMPTCSVYAVKADITAWSEFQEGRKEFLFFDFPKSANAD